MTMIQVKRYLDASESIEEKANKLQKTFDQRKILNYFENLPNELYHEIFDYLDGCQLYEAFSNLNIRFQNILTCSSLLLKIKTNFYLDESIPDRSHIITSNKHQVISLKLIIYWNYGNALPLFTIDSSFNRLESLTLENIRSNELIPLLTCLISLPRLLSLTIDADDEIEDLGNIYQIIFNLPTLKYNKISFFSFETYIPLPIATNNQFSNIENLNIDHFCAIDELIVILSYTPRLCRLSCTQISESNQYNVKPTLSTISSLTHIFIDKCSADFDDLEPFISNISDQLQMLRITCTTYVAYLDAGRWERIISQNLLHLRRFEFKYEEKIDDDLEATFYHEQINRFNSPFWLKRKWIFEIDIDTEFWYNNIIVYSIFPYKKSSVNFNEYRENQSILDNNVDQNVIQQSITTPNILSEVNQLTITDYFYYYTHELLVDIVGSILEGLHITCLIIRRTEIFIGILIDFIRYLPDLNSLVVSSLAMTNPRCLSVEEVTTLKLVSNYNKITKVNLRRMKSLAEIQFLLDLCPRIEYLELDCTNSVLPESLVRFILMKNIKYIPNLSSLCFTISNTNENMIEKLKNMINLEQLHQNYTIKQIDNRIYLQWN